MENITYNWVPNVTIHKHKVVRIKLLDDSHRIEGGKLQL